MNTTTIPKFPGRSPEPFSKALTKNLLVLLIGVSITCINASFIHTFRKHQILYLNPRYIFFIHLVLNDMIQVMLSVILFVISYTIYKINLSICCIFVLIADCATENTPLNVACMAIECYIAVCLPLRHSRICTIKKTLMLIGLIWVTSMSVVLPDLFVTLATQPLESFRSTKVCHKRNVFPNPILVKKRHITHSVFLVIIWFTIFYTYFRILFTARAASKDSKKARNTIILHGFQVLLYMTTYVGPNLLDVIQQHFLVNFLDSMFASYIIVHILPRSISPIIYGVRDENFRKYLRRNMLCKCSSSKRVKCNLWSTIIPVPKMTNPAGVNGVRPVALIYVDMKCELECELAVGGNSSPPEHCLSKTSSPYKLFMVCPCESCPPFYLTLTMQVRSKRAQYATFGGTSFENTSPGGVAYDLHHLWSINEEALNPGAEREIQPQVPDINDQFVRKYGIEC
ncbi:odorant receptor 131-2-like [Antennarius striatus]|uniref:odorant receptor 131-2-like n=1 Tax=Antennarius striatus TaxID=241820 RepID=UPI0035B27F06